MIIIMIIIYSLWLYLY